jgi:hypothetical protein
MDKGFWQMLFQLKNLQHPKHLRANGFRVFGKLYMYAGWIFIVFGDDICKWAASLFLISYFLFLISCSLLFIPCFPHHLITAAAFRPWLILPLNLMGAWPGDSFIHLKPPPEGGGNS